MADKKLIHYIPYTGDNELGFKSNRTPMPQDGTAYSNVIHDPEISTHSLDHRNNCYRSKPDNSRRIARLEERFSKLYPHMHVLISTSGTITIAPVATVLEKSDFIEMLSKMHADGILKTTPEIKKIKQYTVDGINQLLAFEYDIHADQLDYTRLRELTAQQDTGKSHDPKQRIR